MALSNEDKQWIREMLVGMATKTELQEMERRINDNILEVERRINENTADYYNQLKAQVERLGKTVAESIKA